MKKILALVIVAAMVLVIFAGCGDNTKTNKDTMTVGLIQLMEHSSLDEIRTAFTNQLETLAKQEGIEVSIDYKNAQGDMSLIQGICRNFVEDKVDVIVAIATPTAQGALTVTKDVPIVFSAVTDPVDAGLLTNLNAPEGNVTGVSDAINIERIFDLARELTPQAKHFGLLYNAGESNSVSVIKKTKEYLDANGYTYAELMAPNSSEAVQMARMLAESTDALFLPIDNTVASVMPVIAEEAITQKIPVYTAADSMVRDGGFATVGINYTTLGEKTAEMTIQVLKGTAISQIPVEIMEEGTPVFNQETADAIGINIDEYTKG